MPRGDTKGLTFERRSTGGKHARIIQAAAAHARAARALAAKQATEDQIIGELVRIGLSDVRQLFDTNGQLLPVEQWSDAAAASVASLDVVRGNVAGGDGHGDTIAKLRLWPKGEALTTLCRRLGLLTDRQVVDVGPLLERITQGRARARNRPPK